MWKSVACTSYVLGNPISEAHQHDQYIFEHVEMWHAHVIT